MKKKSKANPNVNHSSLTRCVVKSALKSAYRFFQKSFVRRFVLKYWFSYERLAFQPPQTGPLKLKSPSSKRSQKNHLRWEGSLPAKALTNGPYWFHASSVGELESLWPLILLAGEAEPKKLLIVTIFSESAYAALIKLKSALTEMKANVIYCGYSPWEGEWSASFRQFQPKFFITAKYEAWPDLWMSLAEKDIPLVILAARARRSLRIAKILCRILVGRIPRLVLFPSIPDDIPGLEKLFPSAQIPMVGEPRWDRVQARLAVGNPRARELIDAFHQFPKPWGVLGSIWREDLVFLKPILNQIPGTLWVVPHKTNPENLIAIELLLTELNMPSQRTSRRSSSSAASVPHFFQATAAAEARAGQPAENLAVSKDIKSRNPPTLIVDEMGFLSELYVAADWAFVGGGFGVGIHSTIEPAIQGIPIAVGPNRVENFPEALELLKTKQLRVLKHQKDLPSWLASLNHPSRDKKRWIAESHARLGATQKIFTAIEDSQ